MNRKNRSTCNNAFNFTSGIGSFVGALLTAVADNTLKEETKKEYDRLSAMDAIDRSRALRK